MPSSTEITLTTKNVKGVIRNLYAKYPKVVAACVKVNVRAAELTQHIAQDNCPVDYEGPHPGFMRDNIRIDYTKSKLFYEVGWHEEDFIERGYNFYPIFQEFGTSHHPAQPCLFPANELVRKDYPNQLRDAIRGEL